jgi:hypothetical protein
LAIVRATPTSAVQPASLNWASSTTGTQRIAPSVQGSGRQRLWIAVS